MNSARNSTLTTALATSFAFLLLLACPAPAAPGDVKSEVDSPCKYPAGLATDGDLIYMLDWREAKIHAVKPDTGKLAREWDAPTLKPHGLTFADGLLYVSDDHTGGIFVMNVSSGVIERTFQAPNRRATGLAFNDGTLFILAGGTIYRVLPEDGTILGYYDAPTGSSRCLAHDGSYLWVSDRIKDELYMVQPQSGKVLNILPSPGPYPVGIAWREGYLWNVDFQTRKAYRLAIHDDPMYHLSEPRHARAEYLWSLANYGPADVTDLTLNLAVPVALPNQKLLSDPQFSQPPTRTATDRWGQPCAVFDLGRVSAGGKATVSFSIETEVSAIRYLLIPEQAGTLEDIPEKIRSSYTVDGSRYRIDSPYIQETIKRVVGDERNPYWIARKIYDFVIDSLEYQMIGGWDVPEVVLKRGSGSCSEYTYSFVALCRAAGLPARYQGSVVVRGDDASIDEAFHRWAQIYLPNYGWVPVDANRGDQRSPADQARGFGGLSNRFLITTQGGGDSEFLGWGYNALSKYKTTGYCHITEDQFGFWEPLEEAKGASVAARAEGARECDASQ